MPADPKVITDMFTRTPAPMLTFASRGVIVAWNGLRRTARENSEDVKAMLVATENLLKAIQKDLGHGTLTHQNGELAGVWVNDAEDLFRQK